MRDEEISSITGAIVHMIRRPAGVISEVPIVLAGDDGQYDPKRTGLAQDYPYDGSRDHWKPAARSQFSDGPVGTDDGLRRVIEMVVAGVVR